MKLYLLILAGVIVIQACNHEESRPVPTKFQLTKTLSSGKELATAAEKTVEVELMLSGKITFNEDKVARVFPLAGGFVKDLNVELGDYGKKGQVMAGTDREAARRLFQRLEAAQPAQPLGRKLIGPLLDRSP